MVYSDTVVVFTPPPHVPGPRAQSLGRRISAAVRLLREEDPSITADDVRVGLRLADAELRAELGGRSPARIALLLGVAMVLFAVWLIYLFTTHGRGDRVTMAALTGVSVVGMALAIRALKR
ncbi:MAG: hypothetical protein KDE27_02130 [Planctomycetes bacterium]|nr:hypothetical protein [Planctomycetota bacterium]